MTTRVVSWTVVCILLLTATFTFLSPTVAEPSVPRAHLHLREDGRFTLDVPVHVVLVGFPASTEVALQQALAPRRFDHTYNSMPRWLDPERATLQPSGRTIPLPFLPTARYHVTSLPASAALAIEAATVPAPEAPWQSDGNAVEEAVRRALDAASLGVRADLPALVLLHRGEGAMGHPGYVYRGESGWVENARFLGGAHPFLVMDVSAAADPDPTYGSQGRPYESPIPAEGETAVATLALAVEEATRLRLLPAFAYAVPPTPCQAVTVLFAVRTTSGGGVLPVLGDPDTMVDPARLQRSFEALTGAPVFVDLVRIDLPRDDPGLDALTRAVSTATLTWQVPGGASATNTAQVVVFDLLRGWIETNWERYHVPHVGCEPALSVALWGDVADSPNDYGFALHGVSSGHRFSFSSVGWAVRYAAQPDPIDPFGRDPSRGHYDAVETLLAHETGHLLGLAHPHHDPHDPWSDAWAFSKALSIMSYPWHEKTAQFSAIDRANFARNQAAFALDAVRRAGALGTPEADAARAHVEAWRWREATQALQPLLATLPPPPPEPTAIFAEWTCAPGVSACVVDQTSGGCGGEQRITGAGVWGPQKGIVTVSGQAYDCAGPQGEGRYLLVWIDPSGLAPVERTFVVWSQSENESGSSCSIEVAHGDQGHWNGCPMRLAPPDPGWGRMLP